MTTQSKITNPMEAAPRQQFSWPLALAILALGLLMGVVAANLSAVGSKISGAEAAQPVIRAIPARPNMLELEKKANIVVEGQRAIAAEAARYSSLGLYYAAGNQRGLAADTARYSGLAEFYGGANEQRAIAAEAARYSSLGLYYAAGNQRGLAADTARYSGLAEFYGVKITPAASAKDLFIYHQGEWGLVPSASHTLAWPPRPTQFQSIEEVAIDGDVGLMEFSLVTHDTGVRHDREYGQAAFSSAENEARTLAWPPRPAQLTLAKDTEIALALYHQNEGGGVPNKADVSGDIGLMEFSSR